MANLHTPYFLFLLFFMLAVKSCLFNNVKDIEKLLLAKREVQ